jgi:periplasmic divalent cation tolerance protein
MTEACVVLTTASSDATVRALVDRLLGDKLAACVQVLPIRSYYVWKGATVEDGEQLLLIKARRADFAAIEAAIRAVPDYETPEILCLDVAGGSAGYLSWLMDVTERGMGPAS